jgi:hypothetical protein
MSLGKSICDCRDGEVELTLLHLGDEVLVEQTAGLLVQWAVDGDYIALGKHLLEGVNTPAANLLLLGGVERLVVKVQKLLAVKSLETTEHTLADTANGNGTHDLVLEVVLVLRNRGNVPVASGNLLVSWDEVTDEEQDGHDNVLSDGNDVGSRDLGDGDTSVGLVCGIEIDVVGSDTSGNGNLQLLGLCQTLSSEVAGMEAIRPNNVSICTVSALGTRSRGDGAAGQARTCGVTYGVVMMTSASTSSWSNLEFSPSLSDVVTRVWPWSSIHFLMPSSFSVVPSILGSCSAWTPPCDC